MIIGYDEKFQNPDASDYVVLARNLLEDNRADLRHDPNAFRVWLHLLFATRFSDDVEGAVERGQWHVNLAGMASQVSLRTEAVQAALGLLERRGSIRRWIDPEWGDEIVMLPNYDRYQRQVPWPANPQ